MYNKCLHRQGKAKYAAAALSLFILLSLCVQAQPNLNFKRIINNWPTIEAYFSVACDGAPRYDMDKQNFHIYENGEEITDFDIICPDPTSFCPMSVSLVFDASGSMMGAGNQGAKAAGLKFIEEMDGVIDEAAVIWFESAVTVFQTMTNDTVSLQNAMQALPANGSTAVWDGIFVAVEEVIANANNPCRAVIAMTDGGDNSSMHTPSDVIKLAQQNRIRVFCIGLGSGINAADLETIALLTGARYYQTPNADQLAQIYVELMTIIRQGFQECFIRYQRDCMDGTLRTVNFSLVDFCNGQDTKTKTYRAPKDTSTFTLLAIEAGDVSAERGTTARVPIMLATPLAPNSTFHPATFRVLYDTSRLGFIDIDTPPGSLLDTVSMRVTPVPGGVQIQTLSMTKITGSGLLVELLFKAANLNDTTVTAVQVDKWEFTAGCYKPGLKAGSVRIVPEFDISITPSGATTLCEGDSVVLTATENFVRYQWSTGDTTRSIIVKTAGTYTVTGWNEFGQSKVSLPVTVAVNARPQPSIVASGPTTLCEGESVTLSTAQSFFAYHWSNGDTTRETTITPVKSETYTCTVTDGNGCAGTTQPVTVMLKLRPVFDVSGPLLVCKDERSFYSAQQDSRWSYAWSAISGTIEIGQGNAVVGVRWDSVEAVNLLILSVTDLTNGCAKADTIHVRAHRAAVPVISFAGSGFLTTDSAAAYEWRKNGATWTNSTTRQIALVGTGTYTVTITDSVGCSATSAPFSVLSAGDAPSPDEAFNLYPNPFDNQLQVSATLLVPGEISIVVYDLLGKERLRLSDRAGISYERALDVSALPRGLYILRIATPSGGYTKRVMRR